MINEEPFFSICIPMYNSASCIGRAIDSVIVQKFESYEILIIDDGSIDLSGQICDEYAKRDSHINIMHQENRGVFYTRLRLISEAKGKYLLFLDSDDTFEPEALQTIYDSIYGKDIDLLFFDYYRDNGHEKYPSETIWNENRWFDDEKQEIYKVYLGSPVLNNLWTKVIRREILKETVSYSEYGRLQNGEDTLLSIGIIENAKHIGYLHKALYNYSQSENSITTIIDPYRFRQRLKVRLAQLKFMERQGLTSLEWKRLFANGNLRGVLINAVIEIARARIGKAEKKAALNELVNTQIMRENLFPYMDYSGIPIRYKAILLLVVTKQYWLLMLC